jgi:RluA family pseudouridine synthase
MIIYEDKNLIAADKPEGIASISENDTSIETLHSILEKKFNQKLLIVHRLDKEVSGIILFARNSNTHKLLNKQFADRTVKKFYIALVHGNVVKDAGVINKPIREFGSGRMGIDEKNGKPSKTEYKVLERFENYTLLELNPSTGRRHQLRVHLYFIGHPIVGDMRYGDKSIQQNYPRLMLHAKSVELEFQKGKRLNFNSEIPESFNTALKNLLNK